ncbi:MAG: hypothetical protein QS721_06085 [Candidatus Endonucleobacter sp. (ex Gigantidas childressi)]|nr:hypothetical protein [Candidatus Endonucleobacter sp. (ex Gigantidas childressi)]
MMLVTWAAGVHDESPLSLCFYLLSIGRVKGKKQNQFDGWVLLIAAWFFDES